MLTRSLFSDRPSFRIVFFLCSLVKGAAGKFRRTSRIVQSVSLAVAAASPASEALCLALSRPVKPVTCAHTRTPTKHARFFHICVIKINVNFDDSNRLRNEKKGLERLAEEKGGRPPPPPPPGALQAGDGARVPAVDADTSLIYASFFFRKYSL